MMIQVRPFVSRCSRHGQIDPLMRSTHTQTKKRIELASSFLPIYSALLCLFKQKVIVFHHHWKLLTFPDEKNGWESWFWNGFLCCCKFFSWTNLSFGERSLRWLKFFSKNLNISQTFFFKKKNFFRQSFRVKSNLFPSLEAEIPIGILVFSKLIRNVVAAKTNNFSVMKNTNFIGNKI